MKGASFPRPLSPPFAVTALDLGRERHLVVDRIERVLRKFLGGFHLKAFTWPYQMLPPMFDWLAA